MIEIKEIELKIQEYVSQKVISGRTMLQAVGSNSEVTFRKYINMDAMIFEMRNMILREDILDKEVHVEVSYPKNCWEHFKEQFFPERLKKRFPVKLKTKKATEVARLSVLDIENTEKHLEQTLRNRGRCVLNFHIVNQPIIDDSE